MRWAVEIRKTDLDKRSLSDLLQRLGFDLVEGNPFPVFTSGKMDACAEAVQAFEMGKGVREALVGPAQIDSAFELGSVIDYSSEPPKRAVFAEARTAILTVSTYAGSLSESPPKGLSDEDLKQWEMEKAERDYQSKLERQLQKLEPAYRSAGASKVLELLQIGTPSGETLNKIYELMEGNPGNRAHFHGQFGITEHQFNRFQDAVHNPRVSGSWARHAYESKPKTSDPMSKKEAETFVRELTARWLEHIRKTHSATSIP